MARKVNQVLWDQWRQRLDRQRSSGISIVAFCRKEGVSQAALHAWKRKLHAPASARPAVRKATGTRRSRKRRTVAPRRPSSRNPLASATVPTHSMDFLRLPVQGVRSSPWIELSLVDGTLVRIPQENLAALTTLLKVLRGDNLDALSGEAGRA